MWLGSKLTGAGAGRGEPVTVGAGQDWGSERVLNLGLVQVWGEGLMGGLRAKAGAAFGAGDAGVGGCVWGSRIRAAPGLGERLALDPRAGPRCPRGAEGSAPTPSMQLLSGLGLGLPRGRALADGAASPPQTAATRSWWGPCMRVRWAPPPTTGSSRRRASPGCTVSAAPRPGGAHRGWGRGLRWCKPCPFCRHKWMVAPDRGSEPMAPDRLNEEAPDPSCGHPGLLQFLGLGHTLHAALR